MFAVTIVVRHLIFNAVSSSAACAAARHTFEPAAYPASHLLFFPELAEQILDRPCQTTQVRLFALL